MLAIITPPVCISSYIATSIAQVNNALKVGWIAVALVSGGFLVPILFVYRPELMLTGYFIYTVINLLAVASGLFAINTVLFRKFLYRKYKFIEIVVVIISGIMLYFPSYIINISGFLLFSMVVVLQYKDRNKIII